MHAFETERTVCSKCATKSKFREVYECLKSTRIFTLINAQDIHTSSNTYEVYVFEHDLDLIIIPP